MFYFYNSYCNYLQQVESEIEDQSTKLGFQTVTAAIFLTVGTKTSVLCDKCTYANQ